jgi:small subunit ribosomal protein S2
LRAIELYCDLASTAVLDGLQSQMAKAGKDAGEALEVKEVLPAETTPEQSDPVVSEEEAKSAEENTEAEETKKAATA